MRKTIIGIIGEKDAKLQTLCDAIAKNRFKKALVSDKVKEVSRYLMRGEIGESVASKVRERGYMVNKYYWINLLLSSMKDEDMNILIEDLRENDIVDGIMMVYYSSNTDSIQGGTNVNAWDEERVNKEVSRILRLANPNKNIKKLAV